jgi:glutamine amidotransferase
MICIVDYGMGNLRSVQKAVQRVGFEATISTNPRDVRRASRLILPGVGAFKDCMDNLNRFNLVRAVLDFLATGRPFLGICLGLQLLFDESDEFGSHEGMHVLPGKVTRFPHNLTDPETRERLPIPHMGWNRVHAQKCVPLFREIKDDSYFYFVHSYYAVPDRADDVWTTTSYGIDFTSAVQRDNIFAVQFHPEKSHSAGLQLLRNFADI